ncbi:MAG TPA: hypothetical protein VEB86_13400, partial [Chryseosolibacter sp.]|nr:hypothetical protein [Chryseosolibacter sp.]
TFRPLSLNEFAKLANIAEQDNRFVTTAPYTVNNNVSYVSVPLQAGYVLLNRKFGIQLNGGLATDLFIKNRKTADGGELEEIEQGRGKDSPYRPLNFSGLLGTEVTYRVGDRYRIAVNPGLRYPLKSVYKSEVGIESVPVIFDLGVRFRYIFR